MGRYIISYLEFKEYPQPLDKRYYWNTKRGIPIQCSKVSLQIKPVIATNSIPLSEMNNLRGGINGARHPFHGDRRGCIYFVVYPKCLSSYCIVNFTGSQFYYQLDDLLEQAKPWQRKGILDAAKALITSLGDKIQPVYSQFEWFLSEAFVRQDVKTVYDYIMHGIDWGVLRLKHDGDKELLDYLKRPSQLGSKSGLDESRKQWFCQMLYRLECIRYVDSLLCNEGLDRYAKYVDAVRTGNPLEYLAKLKDSDCHIPDVDAESLLFGDSTDDSN